MDGSNKTYGSESATTDASQMADTATIHKLTALIDRFNCSTPSTSSSSSCITNGTNATDGSESATPDTSVVSTADVIKKLTEMQTFMERTMVFSAAHQVTYQRDHRTRYTSWPSIWTAWPSRQPPTQHPPATTNPASTRNHRLLHATLHEHFPQSHTHIVHVLWEMARTIVVLSTSRRLQEAERHRSRHAVSSKRS